MPSGAWAVTAGAAGGRTTIVAAAVRLIVGKLMMEGDRLGAKNGDIGDMVGIKGFS